MENNIIIAGISGQDGYFLTKKLKQKKLKIIGLSRKKRPYGDANLILKTNYKESHLIKIIKKFKPSIIFNFAGESNPQTSWQNPLDKQNSITRVNLNFINAILKTNKKIKYFHASTSEIFASSKNRISEKNLYLPINPYGCFKLCAHLTLDVYRKKYKLFLVNGILFNHESVKKGKKFLSSTIIDAAKKIKKGLKKKLILQTPYPIRDFAHAEDTINAIYKIMMLKKPQDFVISGGNIYSVRKLAEKIFLKFNINKNKIFYKTKSKISDIKIGNTSKLKKLTGWKPKYTKEKFIDKIINDK
jgi:GDPmannose 4,6-dehydratase